MSKGRNLYKLVHYPDIPHVLSLRPHSSQSWFRPEASIRGLPAATRGAPICTHEQDIDAHRSMSGGSSKR